MVVTILRSIYSCCAGTLLIKRDHINYSTFCYDLCYKLKILEWIKRKNLVLELTQENSIENSVQDHLPYIIKLNGLCYYYSSLS